MGNPVEMISNNLGKITSTPGMLSKTRMISPLMQDKNRTLNSKAFSLKKGDTIYLDIRKQITAEAIDGYLKIIGIHVERFLCKDVSCIITDQTVGLNQINDKPAIISRAASRGLALLGKSRSKQTSNGDVFGFAKQWQISVYHIQNVQHLIKKKANFISSQSSIGESSYCTPTKGRVRMLQHNFLKIESQCLQYKPLWSTFKTYPCAVDPRVVNQEVVEKSVASSDVRKPAKFNGGTNEAMISASNSRVTKDDVSVVPSNHTRKEPGRVTPASISVTQRIVEKQHKKSDSGYCECCDVAYSSISKHMQTKQHIQYAACDENYAVLDESIAKLPSLKDFVLQMNELTVETEFDKSRETNTDSLLAHVPIMAELLKDDVDKDINNNLNGENHDRNHSSSFSKKYSNSGKRGGFSYGNFVSTNDVMTSEKHTFSNSMNLHDERTTEHIETWNLKIQEDKLAGPDSICSDSKYLLEKYDETISNMVGTSVVNAQSMDSCIPNVIDHVGSVDPHDGSNSSTVGHDVSTPERVTTVKYNLTPDVSLENTTNVEHDSLWIQNEADEQILDKFKAVGMTEFKPYSSPHSQCSSNHFDNKQKLDDIISAAMACEDFTQEQFDHVPTMLPELNICKNLENCPSNVIHHVLSDYHIGAGQDLCDGSMPVISGERPPVLEKMDVTSVHGLRSLGGELFIVF